MEKLETYLDDNLSNLLKVDNQDAFNEIYKRYWQTLYAIAYNRLRDLQSSEDAVHDVFSSLWANRHTSKISNLSAYLATAVKFRVLDTIRKESHNQKYIQNSSSALFSESTDISETLHHRRLLKALSDEVEKLPAKCRLVFKYSREQHMQVKQIAEEMNISTSTVENHLNKALKRLRELATKMGGQILMAVVLLVG